MTTDATEATKTLPALKRKGGRPKGDPAALRDATIGVRVSAGEYVVLRDKAQQMHMAPTAKVVCRTR